MMALSRFYNWVIIACLFVFGAAKSINPHFRGGSILWNLNSFDQASQKFNVSFTYEFSWTLGYGPCGPSCSQSDVGLIGKHPGPEVFVCEEGCTGRPILANAAYTVSAISHSDQWEKGIGIFFVIFNSIGPFKVTIEGKEWVPLRAELTGEWRMKTELNLGVRSDTSLPNRSPIIFNEGLYQLFAGCLLPFKIMATDPDGDRVRCRWAKGTDECGGVCSGLPGSFLDPELCTVDPRLLLTYGYGHFAVSIVVEDFPYSDVTIGGKVYNSSKPLSQIPTQLLVYLTPTTVTCSQPTFINPPWVGSQTIVIAPNHNYEQTLCGKPFGNAPITGFDVSGPEGMTTSKGQGPLSGSLCIHLKWIPTPQQLGSHFLCVTATQSYGFASLPQCVTLQVNAVDSCKSNPCTNGLSCVQIATSYRCVNKTVSATNNTEITSGTCLQNVLDLVFAVDSSNSLTPSDKLEMKMFMSELAKGFGVGQNKGHIGLVTYDNSPHLVFDLNTFNKEDEVLAAIANVTFGYGGSDTGGVLQFIQEEMFIAQRGDRSYVPNVLVVLTDGHSRDSYATKYFAKKARDLGISIFAVGMGSAIGMTELKDMVSEPSDKYLFTVGSYGSLKSISDHMINTTCTARLPNEVVVVKTTPKPGCYNVNDNCLLYGEGVCTDYPGWSSDHCALWCGFCNGTTTLPPCLDVLKNCPEYGFDVCTKPSLRIWALDHCRAYCGFPPCLGTPSPTTTTHKPTTPGICADRISNCVSYGKGVCSDPAYVGWAKDNCAAFCGYCVEYTDVPPVFVGGFQCPGWRLPTECRMESHSFSCCPLPNCPAGFTLTVNKPHL